VHFFPLLSNKIHSSWKIIFVHNTKDSLNDSTNSDSQPTAEIKIGKCEQVKKSTRQGHLEESDGIDKDEIRND
jgi:hypothetical protein